MLRSSLTAAGVLMLSASALAQADASAKLRPVTSPPKDGGVYHVATGTWTRHAAQATLGADTIYDNTCSSGYYFPFSGDTIVDEGRLPSTSSPTNASSRPGCANSYTIDGFQLAYCTDQLPATFGTYTVNFYETYVNCATVIGATPAAGFALTGMPAAGPGGGRCWIVTLDLDSPPQTASLAFTMLADGDGTFSGSPTGITNLFGWSMTSNAPGTATGAIIAGEPVVCLQYDGTRWDSPINYAEQGTGMSSQNNFRNEGPTTTPGCYWFGGVPFASYHLELYADACSAPPPGIVFCAGDGVAPHTACPCGNNSAAADQVGCLNSFGVGGRLRGTGNPSIGSDTVDLQGSNLPAASVLFFQGTIQQNSGNGSAFGDGLRCAGGTVIRLHTHTATGTPGAATSHYPDTSHGDPSVSVRGMVTGVGVRTYQAWYRNAAAFCTTGTFNLTNGYQITWTL